MTELDFLRRKLVIADRQLAAEIGAHWRTKAVLKALSQYVPATVTQEQVLVAAQDILNRMVMETPTCAKPPNSPATNHAPAPTADGAESPSACAEESVSPSGTN